MGTFTVNGRGTRALACFPSFLALSMLLAGSGHATQVPASGESRYTAFESRSVEQMEPSDAAVVRGKHRDLVTEAAFWGYDLNAGRWVADQVLCPEVPDAIVLHYRRAGAKGESLFTAVVPRGRGQVLIVPVLYNGSTPFESAFGAKRTMSVFNQAVPADVAKRDAGPDGRWLQLAMTYAVMAGAEPRVPRQPEQQAGLMQAPDPTLKAGTTNEVIFSDRQAERKYTVWTIDLSAQGRVTDASIRVIADFQEPQTAATNAAETSPAGKPEKVKKPKKAKQPEEPKVRVIQDAPDPNPKPAPQE